jgi:hypothetical protein
LRNLSIEEYRATRSLLAADTKLSA